MHPDILQFHAVLSQAATRIEEALERFLPSEGVVLADPVRHAVLSGGKRLRAFLAMESAAMFRVPEAQGLCTAAAVECLHAYSLVHDDLPCMDDDDLRRGQPTVHVKWDEATAVLTGDALQSLAFEILASPRSGIDPRIQVRLLHRLSQASGPAGMVAGQALDIAAERAQVDLGLEEISTLQSLKTGALIVWAAESGAILARSDTTPLRNYAQDLGLAFQIQDDILDVEGDAGTVGKHLRKDAEAGKATFVTLLGLDGARRRAFDLAERAVENLAPYGSAAHNLRLAARFAVGRDG